MVPDLKTVIESGSILTAPPGDNQSDIYDLRRNHEHMQFREN